MLKKLKAAVWQAAHRYSFFGKVEEIADRRRHAFNQKLRVANVVVNRCKGKVDAAIAAHPGVSMASAPAAGHTAGLEQLLALARDHRDEMKRKRQFWRRRYVWAHQRHQHWGTVLKHRRDRVRRWVQGHEQFQPYMANGKPWEKLTPEAKHGIYLDFREGLYVTSTYEGHSGDGVHATSSYHYLTNQPDGKGRCWDAGAGTLGPMEKCQRRQAKDFSSWLTEMFGPVNGLAFKNGQQFTLPEGSELETMHDNHVHTDLADGAPE